ncbi:hypothetical protein NDU88_001690 [Pleurodeles waltl]|uniref:Uncharacterized protein n=1 Tax=Pleurodeles waltl TaxID=8319 RepID=A0AAV7NBG8_PLEWA|nr:hypothetical protein NDU88_001690 [Pleurodeles waltl]
MVRCPSGTSDSIALLRRKEERKPEEDVQGIGEEYGRKEDADGQRGEGDSTEVTWRARVTRKDREETVEGCTPTKFKVK